MTVDVGSPGLVGGLRRQLGSSLFARVAGPRGPQMRDRIHNTPGERWFGPERPIRVVHADASMFVGGLSALLLQSLHPLAMAGVAAHSGYRGDPWGRLQRTSLFLATTTYGTAADALAAVERVHAVHRRVQGVTDDGRRYSAADPHLLKWVHITEAYSFLAAHQRYGADPLEATDADGYLEDLARVGTALGVQDPPRTTTALRDQLEAYRPELAPSADARDAARFLLVRPPLPLAARVPYAVLAAAAVGLLPAWARRPLRLPRLPVTERIVVRPAGDVLVRSIRWVMTPVPPASHEDVPAA